MKSYRETSIRMQSIGGKGERTDGRLFKFEGWTEAALKACK